MLKKRYSFIAFFNYEDRGISIDFPVLPGCCPCAEPDDTNKAISNAQEALGLHLYGMEQDHEAIPEPSSLDSLTIPSGCVPVMISVFMPAIRDRVKNNFVKKTLSLPAWLAAAADADGVNCSRVFQTALMDYLGVQGPPRA